MSRRASIAVALANKLKEINGTGAYSTNIFNNAYPILKFWNEVSDFPSIYISPGSEQREYQPCDLVWGILNLSIKVYAKGEDSQIVLEALLEDVENCLRANRQFVYDTTNIYSVTETEIHNIVTDEGLLQPYAVGEVSVQIRYQVMN